jgi:uncharacterized protein (DUF952 family)
MIFHICPKSDWHEALAHGAYTGDTLASEGFIHCSTREQVLEIANHRFRARHDLNLLLIDEDKVTPRLVYEEASNGKRYPHIYGPLNLNAVTEVIGFSPLSDGRFELPAKLVG